MALQMTNVSGHLVGFNLMTYNNRNDNPYQPQLEHNEKILFDVSDHPPNSAKCKDDVIKQQLCESLSLIVHFHYLSVAHYQFTWMSVLHIEADGFSFSWSICSYDTEWPLCRAARHGGLSRSPHAATQRKIG